ncbi:2-dehydro-3-deoxygluconokinase [Actinopolyspora xinjiangensis]|uniref:2-dehydro-3-deoxygluconokinase n=1 Tax=Actinopolyspora xinjiangensis TaxID=405564 RepID=A0A1H0NM35_9ACTN|nr:sugar kinase [Actinopolyspora xinjiangensis]SDO93420.1 2-dehydro-3-deoxygluconokinase [Actinopolyspora xinjiangensis]
MIPEVITFGETMGLLLAQPGQPLEHATGFRRSLAGAESNTAVGLARLGHRVGWFGRVGDDPFGRSALRTLRGEGVDVSRVVVDGSLPTGLLVRDAHAHRPIEVCYYRSGSAGSALCDGDVDGEWIGRARLLHLTGITAALSDSARSATERAVRAAAEAGVPVSLDPNIRRKLAGTEQWGELLRPLADHAELVLTGLDEAETVSDRSGERAAATWFLERGAKFVVVKLGSRGAWATDGAEEWFQPAAEVPAVDPVGAGDAFNAGFLSGHLRGLPVPESLAEAATVAGSAVQIPGDMDGLPDARLRDLSLGDEQVTAR